VPNRPLLAIACAIVLLPGLAEAADRQPGRSYWVRGFWFQYLGPDDQARPRWAYPHLEGAAEVFTAPADPGTPSPWVGDLGSRFDPRQGRFLRRFHAAGLANVLTGERSGAAQKAAAATRLARFLTLRSDAGLPYYLRGLERTIQRRLPRAERRALEGFARARASLRERFGPLGTRPGNPPLQLRSAEDHYRALLEDGYLDVAVVGGNSYDEDTGKVYSAAILQELREGLRGMGLEAESPDGTLLGKALTLRGRRVRARLQVTGGARSRAQARRAVATFVEGLAQADVVIYVGHSNHGTGTYYLSEDKGTYARFRIGLGRHDDLLAKCHDLGSRRHQILSLQSCSSYPKYGQPLADYHREQLGALAAPVGFVATPDLALFGDFVPRTLRFLELLLAGSGPRAMALEVSNLRPFPKTPPMVLRGVLQERGTFLTPAGVEIGAVQELGAEAGYLVFGAGSDGQSYPSTEVFPQDRPGQVIQVDLADDTLYGVSDDGRLFRVGPRTQGAQEEVLAPRLAGRRVSRVAYAERKGKARLHLLDDEGRIRTLGKADGPLRVPRCQAPKGVRFIALGRGPEGQLAAVAEDGSRWLRARGRWEPAPAEAKVEVPPCLKAGAALTRVPR
jgi:hypothetical protein